MTPDSFQKFFVISTLCLALPIAIASKADARVQDARPCSAAVLIAGSGVHINRPAPDVLCRPST